MTQVYKLTYTLIDYSGPMGAHEREFLLDMESELTLHRVRVDQELLESAVEAWQRIGSQPPPKELVEWLQKQVKDGALELVVE